MSRGEPGRICPVRYRYGPGAIASAPTRPAQTLYVAGGLYGNTPALDCIEATADAEERDVTLCFNGDFNWFDVADAQFVEINRRVFAHDAIQGNVEAEFDAATDDAGCGCAYPDSVEAGVVERSNRIHALLRATASRHSEIRSRIAKLPMVARYQVAGCRIGVVHGDAEALAGWRFDVDALDAPDAPAWLRSVAATAQVDLFASTHTCLPAMRRVSLQGGSDGWVVNNGAAGMPNFTDDLSGLITRVGVTPRGHLTLPACDRERGRGGGCLRGVGARALRCDVLAVDLSGTVAGGFRCLGIVFPADHPGAGVHARASSFRSSRSIDDYRRDRNL